jgi:hypothetical protein
VPVHLLLWFCTLFLCLPSSFMPHGCVWNILLYASNMLPSSDMYLLYDSALDSWLKKQFCWLYAAPCYRITFCGYTTWEQRRRHILYVLFSYNRSYLARLLTALCLKITVRPPVSSFVIPSHRGSVLFCSSSFLLFSVASMYR